MATISFVGVGTFQAGNGNLSVPAPAGLQRGDLLILLIESENEPIATPTSAEGTWTQIGTQATSATGAAKAAGATRLAVYYKYTDGTEGNASVSDTGDHTTAQMAAYRRVHRTNPVHAVAQGATAGTTTAALTLPAVTTTVPGCQILLCIANDRDVTTSPTNNPSFNTATNANLTGIAKRLDATNVVADGGGVCSQDGIFASTGSTGTTSVTKQANFTSAASAGYTVVALRPARRIIKYT